MIISKENSANVNDKIQKVRDGILPLIATIRLLRTGSNVSLILTALQLANMNAWRGQMINNGFEFTPKIEPDYVNTLPESANSAGVLTTALAVQMCEQISQCISTIIELLSVTKEEEMAFLIKIEGVAHEEVEKIELDYQQTFAVERSFSRVIDNLTDASNWINYHIEKKGHLIE